MSEDLVTIDANQGLQTGGIGIGSAIFKGRPQLLELVQRTTRQEGAQPGKFRNVATGEHFDELRVVLLAVPQEQREKYRQDGTFSKDNKLCFSLDNVQPHPRAKEPPAMYCATCPDGDVNWAKWRQTKDPKDLPPCSMYYHLFLAEKTTQTEYYLNLKGQSVAPFKQAMETQMFGLFQKVIADVKAKNKLRGYVFNAKSNIFSKTPDFVVPEGEKQAEPLPLPSIFDISFTLYVTTKDKGGPPVAACKDFRLMQDEQRAEFGALYLQNIQRKAENKVAYEAQQLTATSEAQASEAVYEAPPSKPVVLPGPPIAQAEVVKEEPITI